jgi:hypothetical protein
MYKHNAQEVRDAALLAECREFIGRTYDAVAALFDLKPAAILKKLDKRLAGREVDADEVPGNRDDPAGDVQGN